MSRWVKEAEIRDSAKCKIIQWGRTIRIIVVSIVIAFPILEVVTTIVQGIVPWLA